MTETKIKPSEAGEFCTVAWAAEHLGVSMRQIGRYITCGLLTGIVPLTGSRETGRRHRLLSTSQVRTFRDAREVIGRA